MYREIRRKEVVCRKSHLCDWCAEVVKEDEKAVYRVYVCDGFIHGWMHPECWGAMLTMVSDWFEGDTWDPGDFKRGSWEFAG